MGRLIQSDCSQWSRLGHPILLGKVIGNVSLLSRLKVQSEPINMDPSEFQAWSNLVHRSGTEVACLGSSDSAKLSHL